MLKCLNKSNDFKSFLWHARLLNFVVKNSYSWSMFVWLQVRQKASKILGGLVHSQFLDSEAQKRLLQYFRSLIRSKMTRGNKKSKFQKTAKTEDKVQLATFHAGILGLCAFVEAYPYDVPEFVPEILVWNIFGNILWLLFFLSRFLKYPLLKVLPKAVVLFK